MVFLTVFRQVPESVTNESISIIPAVTGKSILKNVEAVQNEMHLGNSTTIEENDEEESEQQETVEFEKVLLRNEYNNKYIMTYVFIDTGRHSRKEN